LTGQGDSRVTQLLAAIGEGDPVATDELLPLVYTELRALAHKRMAAEPPGHTLEATALVHEAYLRLIGEGDPAATDELLPLVYTELRALAHKRMAAEPPGHTLEATALVHEAYLRVG
jgi:hypothetical protein